MKDSHFSLTNNKKRTGGENSLSFSVSRRKRCRAIIKLASIHLQYVDVPLVLPTTGSAIHSICLEPDRPYTIGRTHGSCEFVFHDRRVSKQHCQILFDSFQRKIYILDGAFLLRGFSCIVNEFRRRLLMCSELEEEEEIVDSSRVRASLNGVFVNGYRIKRGMVRELCAGDEVLLACGSEGVCNFRARIGFVIQGIVFREEAFMGFNGNVFDRPRLLEGVRSTGYSQGSMFSGKSNKRVFAIQESDIISRLKHEVIIGRANSLLSQCRQILHSDNPITCIRQLVMSDCGRDSTCTCKVKLSNFPCLKPSSVDGETNLKSVAPVLGHQTLLQCENSPVDHEMENRMANHEPAHPYVQYDKLHKKEIVGIPSENAASSNDGKILSSNVLGFNSAVPKKSLETSCSPPGKKFYLNRLEFMGFGSFNHHSVISLPELLYPVESISRMFIATFTSEILWFLSYCEIPSHLPVTIACHDTERCWSSSPEKRFSMPYPDFPNLVVVYPPFPEAIAFGKDRKKKGIGCHHPKLLVLQREDSLRVVITSANLVSKQWTSVTNTIWWQDFPRMSDPDFSSLFIQASDGEINENSGSDFASQLAGFMASLVTGVPSQAHWIVELTKYDFGGATGHLVASVPGIHLYRTPSISESLHVLSASKFASQSFGVKFLGSVEASVAGLSHLFRTAADSNGAQLKRLAGFLGKFHEDTHGMSEILLKRNPNVPADANAVSVVVPNPNEFSERDCIQLGFLPRSVAKWISPLWDVGFFIFSGYICPKEALAAALEGSGTRVQLILHVSQGPNFPDMSKMMKPEHVAAFCSLIASIQRCTGLWRLEEVLGHYKWAGLQESDFVYGSSSIGSSVNAQFLAAFAAAAGKKSLQRFDSEESDPEWGCWSASQELKTPSIRIIFPTVERVKNACNGIFSSKHLLCFSEKTWQRLRTLGILHDAIPHPYERVGHPMHVKVARRRFLSRTNASPFGWVYCGSHNFSAAAWGRQISNPFGINSNEPRKTNAYSGVRLHVCNYELGILFVFPPTETKDSTNECRENLDNIVLPFVVPAPKYDPRDRPATAQAMREALAELTEEEKQKLIEIATTEEIMEEIPDEEEEVVEATDYVVEEREDEKAYAEVLWCQVDSSQSS